MLLILAAATADYSYPDRANHSDLARFNGRGVELHISDTAGGNPTQRLALDTTDGSTAVCMLMVERQNTTTELGKFDNNVSVDQGRSWGTVRGRKDSAARQRTRETAH